MALRIPDHAAVSATVAAARVLQRPRTAGLVNATLRRFQRERETLLAETERDDSARWLTPHWLLRRFRAAWPDDWEQIVAASNGRGPMFLRINRLRTSTSAYRQRLAEAQIAAEPLPAQPSALRLARPMPTAALPGFDQGEVSVQDAGAQWAAELLAPQPGDTVLDACAAPGGKTAHLLERAGGQLQLTALDVSAGRLKTLRANLHRLGLEARICTADATQPEPSWAQTRYARILLDAPCSATGVIRRHPDIKQLRREHDIAELARVQAALLDALWPLLQPGGCLLYLTCSILPEENEAQIANFLLRQPEAEALPLPADLGRARHVGRQLLPTEDGPDGFYFALLQKPAPVPLANG
jgi:16S rRNA (cytosine967-C5)-methyltransferase